MKTLSFSLKLIALVLLNSCSDDNEGSNHVHLSSDQTHATERHTHTNETYSLKNLVKENKFVPDSVIRALNAQHHHLNVLERRTVPGPFVAPAMKFFAEHIAKVEDLPAINPGPGEYVHVMEGQRHGYNNLTIGITETFPNGAPPMHSHEGEESHVLLEGDILYALGDTMFTMKGPYIVNIPAGVPHAFKNIDNKTANMVVIFPTNIWKYDVLDYFPFKSDTTKPGSKQPGQK